MFRRKLGDKFGDLDPAHVNIVVVSDTAGLKYMLALLQWICCSHENLTSARESR
jgi:hypothetical protein